MFCEMRWKPSAALNPPPIPPEEGSHLERDGVLFPSPPSRRATAPLRRDGGWEGSGMGLRVAVRTAALSVLAAFIMVVSVTETAARLFRARNLPQPLLGLLQWASPLRTLNTYSLF